MSGSFGNYCVSGVTQKWLPTFWEYFTTKDLANSVWMALPLTFFFFFFINEISAPQQTLDNYPIWKHSPAWQPIWKRSPAWQPRQCTSIQGPISNPPINSPFPTGCCLSVIPLRKVNLGWWRYILCTQRKSCTINYLCGLRKASQVEN